jgi:hypothetical protein
MRATPCTGDRPAASPPFKRHEFDAGLKIAARVDLVYETAFCRRGYAPHAGRAGGSLPGAREDLTIAALWPRGGYGGQMLPLLDRNTRERSAARQGLIG